MSVSEREYRTRVNGEDERDRPVSQATVLIDKVDAAIHNNSLLHNVGYKLSSDLHQWFLQSKDRRKIEDILHGTWLGHPLHAVLVEIVVGSFSLGTFFDFVSLITRSRTSQKMADSLTRIGVVMSVPTAMAGMTDYSGIKKDAVSHGALHGMLNTVGLVFYLLSLRARHRNRRLTGIFWSMLGISVMTFSAWLGGELVYRFRVGVNHAEDASEPERWMPIMAEGDLREGQPWRMDVEGNPVLLYRKAGEIYAIGAVCSHAGGPLEEGKFEGTCVQCPWHDSVFDLRDGSVVHGPSTYRQPTYQARVFNGQVELRVVNPYEHAG
jgi:nitrite reductase/ring-hydroxylating ferredoxin subunit/uncharacterized membrane protein